MANDKTHCLIESEAASTNEVLEEMKEKLMSEGNIREAESVEETIKELDKLPLCG